MKDPAHPYLDWLDHGADAPSKISEVGWNRAADVLLDRMRQVRPEVLAGDVAALSMYMRSYTQVGALVSWAEFMGPYTAGLDKGKLKQDVKKVLFRRDLIEGAMSRAGGRHVLDGMLRRRGARKLNEAAREMVDQARINWTSMTNAKQLLATRSQDRELAKHYKRTERYQSECQANGVFLTRRQAYELTSLLRGQARLEARKLGFSKGWFITAATTLANEACAYLSDRSIREFLWRQKQMLHETDASVSAVLAMRHQEAVSANHNDYASYQLASHAISNPRTVRSILSTFLENSVPAQRAIRRGIQKMGQTLGLDEVQPWDESWVVELSRNEHIAEPDQAFSLDCALNVIIPEILELGQWRVENLRSYDVGGRQRWCYDLIHQGSVDKIQEILAENPFAVVPQPRRAQFWFVPYDHNPHENLKEGAYELAVRSRWNALGSESPMTGYTDQVSSTHEDVSAVAKPLICINLLMTDGKKWLQWKDVSSLVHELGHLLHDLASQPQHYGYADNYPVDMVEFPSQFLESIAQDPRMLVKWAKASVGSDKKARKVAFWTRWIQMESLWVGSIRTQAIDGLVDLDLHRMKVKPGELVDVKQFYMDTCERYGVACHPDDRSIYMDFMWEGYVSCYYSYTFGQLLSRALVPRRKDMTINGERVKKLFAQLLNEVLPVGIDGKKFAKAWKRWRGEKLKDSLYRGARLYGKDMSVYVKANQGRLPTDA